MTPSQTMPGYALNYARLHIENHGKVRSKFYQVPDYTRYTVPEVFTRKPNLQTTYATTMPCIPQMHPPNKKTIKKKSKHKQQHKQTQTRKNTQKASNTQTQTTSKLIK